MAPPLDPIASLRAALRGHYEIEREIGQGAFATVYLARDLKHERKVALKVLHADPSSETGELRFIREIRLLARLQHPNILPLHDSGHVETLLYYVMPYVSGETLRDRIDRERQLSTEVACNIARDVADALAYAHAQGVIHRDIKPENILLSAGHPVLADFGIARAIDLAGVQQLTRTGKGSPGTPAYMSPEQMMGEAPLDGRSDTYSLGCVLFEMLTGKPPFAGKEGFVKRFTEPPPNPSSIRKNLPAWMDEVVTRSLAKNPNDRYQTAQEFVVALTSAGSVSQDPQVSQVSPLEMQRSRSVSAERSEIGDAVRSGQSHRSVSAPAVSSSAGAASYEAPVQTFQRPSIERLVRLGRRSRVTMSAAIVVMVVATIITAISLKRNEWGLFGFRVPPDPSKLVILPFAETDKATHGLATQASDGLYEAFRRWDGLNVVTDLQVNEAVSKNGRAPATLTEALALARSLGAGRLVWGHIVSSGDTVGPRAELYDVSQPSSSTKEVMIDPSLGSNAFSSAVLQLLAPLNRPATALGGDGLTRNYLAWQAYNRGHIALRSWDLARAQAEFDTAVTADPRYPVARLWQGQLVEWQAPGQPERWREHAERAATDAPRMLERDRLLSIALAAMAHKQYPAACEAYRNLTGLDSLDFIGWYGLGECQALDRAVLPDKASPSQWRWRSSYDAAVKSYAHALRLEPGAHAILSFERLRRLLPTAATNPRTDDAANTTFAAYPSLGGDDTLSFVPYPVSVFASGLPPAATATLNRALDRNADVLFDMANRWVQIAPRNPDALEALADVLETRGDIASGGAANASAAGAVREALSLTTDPQQRIRLVVRDGILRFRRGDYEGTSRLADSLFRTPDLTDNNTAPVLISLAALTGRVGAMANLAKGVALPARLDGIAIPLTVSEVAAKLFAAAALGVCGDTLTALRQRLEQQIQSSVAESQRAAARAALVSRPFSMMVPCTAGASALDIPPSANKLHRLQQAFARHDAPGVQTGLREIAQTRRATRPTDWSLDYIYQEAWVRAAMGDTAEAIAELDRSLNSISALSGPALREPAASAAVGRAMAFRADLAAQTGDASSARRWARAVTALWAHADPSLQPTLSRMKTLGSGP
jgi:serine/threonine protein kinase/tetratricopeptide (TPR) repeat protein